MGERFGGWNPQSAGEVRKITEDVMEQLNVVGAAVAIVAADEVVLAEGFGVRDKTSAQPVTEETLFAIGSSTKAFTTMSVAMLAEAEKLDWDGKVRDYIPEFQLHDSIATAEATPRDLACHRVGLPRHEFSWYKAPLSRKELIDRLRYLKPSKPFRTTFQYQNMMFTTLGYLVERVAGSVWESYVAKQILQPLGMTRTNFSVDDAQNDSNHAKPFVTKDGTNQEVPFANLDALGPAGSINSCVRDMARWVRLHLNSGEVDGQRLLSEAGVKQMHRPHVVIPPSREDTRLNAPAYGLGWFTVVYRGMPLVHHGGNIDGFSALVLMMPEQEVGIVVLCNQEVSVFPTAVAYSVIDKLFGLPQDDWATELDAALRKQLTEVMGGNQDFSAQQQEGTNPSHPAGDYAGRYSHPAYGTVAVTVRGEQLAVQYHTWPEPVALEHYHYDVFLMRAVMETVPLTWRVPFRTGLDGRVDELEIQFESMVDPIVFKRENDGGGTNQ